LALSTLLGERLNEVETGRREARRPPEAGDGPKAAALLES